MSTYTCPHCGQHDLSTQRRHNCPKLPSLSIPLGPPRSRDPIANEYIASLTRELEEARNLIRDLVEDEDAGLVWLGRRLVCAYCTADGLYSVDHAADCPIIRARHALAALRPEAQGDGPVR